MKAKSKMVQNLTFVSVFMGLIMSLQADYYVARNGSNTDEYPYDSWANAASNIQTVVDSDIPSGSTIWVGDGTYSEPDQAAVVILPTKKSFVLRGNASEPGRVILDGKGAQRGLTVSFGASDLSLELDGFTFTNCYVNGTGGGINVGRSSTTYSNHTVVVRNCVFVQNKVSDNSGGAVALNDASSAPRTFDALFSNCVFSANSAMNGGAVFIRNRNLTMVDCRAVGNVAEGNSGGGALWLYQNESVNLRGCTFLSNRCVNAVGGGGLYSYVAPCILSDCLFEDNEAIEAGGGAIYARGDIVATNCIFRNNRATSSLKYGGAINVWPTVSKVWLVNCLIVGNRSNIEANTHTHAIYGANSAEGDYRIINSTVVSNSGGVGVMGNKKAPTVEIRNSIIRYNNQRASGTTANYDLNGVGGTFKIYNTATTPEPPVDFDGGGNITDDPKFVSAAGVDFHLQPGSPWIDAGLNQDWMIGAVDLSGRPRLDRHSQTVDMGCYEYQKSGSVLIMR